MKYFWGVVCGLGLIFLWTHGGDTGQKIVVSDCMNYGEFKFKSWTFKCELKETGKQNASTEAL